MLLPINILYWGGTGGFCLLHTLLLSDESFCCIPLNQYKNNIFTQWSRDYDNWKSRELWPDNKCTLSSPSTLRKILFSCNDFSGWMSYPGKKVLLYTDLKTHIEMCYLKKSNFLQYEDPSSYINKMLSNKISFNGCDISPEYTSALEHFDISIKLQDLCTNPESELSKLGIIANAKQKNFLNFWINLHPKHIKDLLLH